MGPEKTAAPPGSRVRAMGSFCGFPEAAAFGAALMLYLPQAGTQLKMAASALGLLTCAAAISLRRAAARGAERGKPPPSRAFLQRCLAAAGLGLGLVLGCLVRQGSEGNGREWSGLPLAGISSFSGSLSADSRKSSGGLTLYDIEIDWVRSEFSGAQASLSRVLMARGGPELSAGERIKVDSPLPPSGPSAAPGGLLFAQAASVSSLGFPDPLAAARARARRGFIACVGRIASSGRPLLIALMTGDRSALSKEEEAAYRKAGCVHILALSGQHIGILAGLLGFLLVPCLGKRAALVLSALAVLLYLLVTGIQASMLRSVLSYIISALAWFLGRKPRSSSVLAWTFLIAVAAQPESPGSASFLLSYGATAGIILYARPLGLFLSKWLPPPLATALGLSIGACACSAPIAIGLFGSFNPGCVLSSTAAGPLVTLIMWIGCGGSLACALLPFPFVGQAVGAALELPYRCLSLVVGAGAALPSLSFPPGGQRAAAALVLAFCILLLYAWRLYGTPRIRFPQGPQEIHGRARLRHAEEVRPEFPGGPERAG